MSSFKNAFHAREHRERGQPVRRRRFGLLEKHKDYVLRARDYHQKEKALNKLREKARLRNWDEFNFGMVHTQVDEQGVHHARRTGKPHTHKQLQEMRTQDLMYMVTKEVVEQKKIEKMKSHLQGIDTTSTQPNKHVVFVESEEQLQKFDPVEYFETVPELVDQAYNRPKKEQLAEQGYITGIDTDVAQEQPQVVQRDLQRAARQRKRLYSELEQREERKKKFAQTVDEIQLQRHLMGKGKRRKISEGKDGRPPVWKWASERKR